MPINFSLTPVTLRLLQGYLFFGTTHSLLSHVRARARPGAIPGALPRGGLPLREWPGLVGGVQFHPVTAVG